MNAYQTERKKEKKNNYIEYKPKIDTKINIDDLISKREGFKRSFADKDIIGDNILGKKGLIKTKSEIQFPERHRFNTYQNKKQLEHSIGSIDRDILKIGKKWGDVEKIKEKIQHILKCLLVGHSNSTCKIHPFFVELKFGSQPLIQTFWD